VDLTSIIEDRLKGMPMADRYIVREEIISSLGARNMDDEDQDFEEKANAPRR
jgi:hypothetical protein